MKLKNVENQMVEWKAVWKDEYLKWICGFANAQGGKIFIGVDDEGNVIGLKNGRKLLEEISNKVQTTMGIVANVNLISQGTLEYLEVDVPMSSFPVNYKGEYYYRSGSTKQQLKG